MVGAPKGNRNAEKWTHEEAELFCNKVLEYVRSDERCRSITTACAKLGKYETLINYFEDKFGIVFESIKEAKAIVKGRLMEQALDGDANATMAIFILKNNHDMADKVEQKSETTITGINLKDLVKFE